ncbi:MAG: hypothetical protein ACOH2N_00085 [Devosia sp.]
MADIDFPSSLPCMLSGTLEETTTEPWVSDQGEVGAPRRRKRFTRALRGFSFSMRLDNADKDALLAFYDEILDDGVKPFNWTHPWTAAIYEVRFTGRPSIQHRYNRYWSIEIALEQI